MGLVEVIVTGYQSLVSKLLAYSEIVTEVDERRLVRPSPLQWLRYATVGSVPRKNRAWVLRDVTCHTWALRHAARYLVLVVPLIAAVILFVPAPLSVRIEASFAAGGGLFIGYLCFTTESLEHRAEKAGYPYGLAARLREERSIAEQRASAARFRARRQNRS